MIRAKTDLLMIDRNRLNDMVLYDLLNDGIDDWLEPNNRLHQATQAIRHSTAIHMRMLAKHLQLEDKVRPLSFAIKLKRVDVFVDRVSRMGVPRELYRGGGGFQ
jgi:hypothetical protein